jgi:glutathione S-transferase
MKLYRFPYSPYVLKVQLLLDLMGQKYEAIDVPYGDRTELATLTGGYIYVPVLEDGGQVVFDSRRICQRLVGEGGAFVPAPLEGPIWAYHDWCDGPLEDVLFRIGSPGIRDSWKTAGERALYVLIKERKFGVGCVEAWERGVEELVAKGNELLAPSARTLAAQPFLFGAQPTLADCALYGLFAFLRVASPANVGRFPAVFQPWMRRLEELAAARR